MANVNIKFNNKEYLLSCDDGQEANLKKLASHLDAKYNQLKSSLGNLGENKLLLITAIQMVDEYFDLMKKVKNNKNDFETMSKRFKELRSLAIKYKDEKDKEIEKLNTMSNKVIKMTNDIDYLNNEKNQLLREKNESEKKFMDLSEQYEELNNELKKIDTDVVKKFGNKENFNKKIDELNQETETLIDEIEKWQT